MKIFVKAKPNAKNEKVIKNDEIHFEVSVKEPPRQGMANAAVIIALADFLNIAPSRLQIISGHTSRNKIIEVK
ncbi:MAG: DUF167 domain-containing protein [Patescibacteria group bacterium]